jgi:endoglucanase
MSWADNRFPTAWRAPRRLARLLVGAAVLSCTLTGSAAQAAAPQIHISGNHFADQSGNTIRLIGVNAGPDLSDACVFPSFGDQYRKGGVWGGPVSDAAVGAIASWKVDAVRISLNEDCWLGVNPVTQGVSRISFVRRNAAAAGRKEAARYRSQVMAYVRRLHAHGMIVIIDLHWSAPGSSLAFNQFPLADADHSPAFWRSVASAFKSDHSIVFDAFNEPYISNSSQLTWSCLRNGCRLPDECADCRASDVPAGCGAACPLRTHAHGTYQAAGIQSLVNAIRSTGATQPIIAPGLDYTNDLSQWWRFHPTDPRHQLGVSFHAYGNEACSTSSCWDQVVAPLATYVPVVIGEFGPALYDSQGHQLRSPCDQSYDQGLMDWADQHGVSYLAWDWYYDDTDNGDQPGNCTWNLIDGGWFAGTPREGHGQAVHDHLAALSAAQGGGEILS